MARSLIKPPYVRTFTKPTYILYATTPEQLRNEIVQLLHKREMHDAAELLEDAILDRIYDKAA